MIINVDELEALVRYEDWEAAHAMLDEARDSAATAEDLKRAVYWRSVALETQERYEDALDLLRTN